MKKILKQSFVILLVLFFSQACKKGNIENSATKDTTTLKSGGGSYIRSALSGKVVGIASGNGYSIFNLDTALQDIQINSTVYHSFQQFHISGSDSASLYLIFSGTTNDTAAEFNRIIIGIPVVIDGSEPPAHVACPKEEHTCESTSDPVFGNLFYCSCCGFQKNTAGCIIGCKCSCEAGRCKHTIKALQGSTTSPDWATPFVQNPSL